MVPGADRSVGIALLACGGTAFTAYTFWILGLPFFDKDHVIHEYSPSRYTLILVPYLTILCILFGLGAMVTYHRVKTFPVPPQKKE